MTEAIKKASRYATLGVDSDYSPNWGIRQDEFLPDLRGERGIKRLREMAQNDPIVGAILSAMDLMIRSTPWRIEGGSQMGKDLVEYCLHHMEDTTFEMVLSDILSFLPYGFSLFEIVARPPGQHPDGWITLRKLAPRAQWTIERFEVDRTGRILGVWQSATTGSAYIPYSKLLHFRTASKQNDPAGMSVLRSAYSSWYFANRIKEIEAVAIERELNGLPLVRVPAEYLDPDATDAQKAFVSRIQSIARDVKRNEQGYIILPSDLYENADGKMTGTRLVDFELIASQGKRDIDTHQVVVRYQMDMARSALADFVLLGANDRGSFALSKSKADLFLKALEGYLDAIASVLNRKLVPKLMAWNGIAMSDAPKIMHGRVAPTDLNELGNYIQRLGGLGVDLTDAPSEDFLRNAAGLPPAASRADLPNTESTSATQTNR
jgi:phage gp29-like protein